MLPFQCFLCHSQETARLLCPACLVTVNQLRIKTACPQCGQPAATNNTPCGHCLKNRPAYDRIIAPFLFTYPLDALVRKFKYASAYHFAKFLTQLLPPVQPPAADCVIPMPLHPERERWRGFNQSRELCKALRLPYREAYLQRVKHTEMQAKLSGRAARIKNIKGAFRAGIEVYNQTILLVDDIVTSGSTVHEASRTLKKAGAQSVIVFALARAQLT